MAEPVGLASGLLSLATVAFQSSITLVKTIQSFQNHPKRVGDLQEELEALISVLSSLTETVRSTTDVDLSALDLPLQRCGNACKEFEQEIIKCSSRSGSNRASFRDWAKLRYMGDDIDSFRRLLSGYKSTIIIALTDVNLRKSAATAENLEIYRDLVKTATDELEARLQAIDDKLEALFGDFMTRSDSDVTQLRHIKEERSSTRKCLQICAQLSKHINEIQFTTERDSRTSGNLDPDSLPERLTIDGLQECKNSLAVTIARLERNMKDLVDRLVTKSRAAMTTEEEVSDLARLRDEWDAARQCMEICSKADTHLKENISTIENYATGDAVQFMVSTDGRTIYGKNRGLGWRTRQVGGHISDASVQKLSTDFSTIQLHNLRSESSSSHGKAPSVSDDEMGNKSHSEFQDRWGQGFKLVSKTPVASPTTSTGVADGRPGGT